MQNSFLARAASVLIVAACCYACDGQESKQTSWLQFRGPGFSATGNAPAPTKWDSETNLKWRTELPGRGASSVTVVKDRLFVTAYSGYGISLDEVADKSDLRLHLLCFDRDSGAKIWQRTIAGSQHSQMPDPHFVTHGFATSTPASDGESVYCNFGVNGVYAFDLSGKLLWQSDIGIGTDPYGSSSSPIVFNDLLIVNASVQSNAMIAFDKSTGKLVWEVKLINSSWATPVIGKSESGRDELVLADKGWVRGFDPKTGSEFWRCRGIENYIVSTPVVHNGLAYFIGGTTSKNTLAIELGGKGDVSESHERWRSKFGDNLTSAICYGDFLYYVTHQGLYCSFGLKTGEPLKRNRSGAKQKVYASLTRAGDYFYLPTENQGILVIKAEQRPTLIEENKFDDDNDPIRTALTILDGEIYYRTDSFLYCISENGNGLATDRPAPQEFAEINPVEKSRPALKRQLSKRPKLFLSATTQRRSELFRTPYKLVLENNQIESVNDLVAAHDQDYKLFQERLEAVLNSQTKTTAAEIDGKINQIETELDTLYKSIHAEVRGLLSKEQLKQHRENMKKLRGGK